MTYWVFILAAWGLQAPGSVDPNPTPPPTAPVPVFANTAGSVSPGGFFEDVGTGRGLALVDIVGPDPADPTNPLKIGPADGVLDLVQTNSNSPALPYGSTSSTWVVPPVGTVHADCRVWRGDAAGSWTEVSRTMSPQDLTGWNLKNPGGSPWGVLSGDVDSDGDLDLFYVCGGFNTTARNALMQAQGDGTFVNVTAAAGFSEVQASFGATFLDKDLDGDLDLYVANGAKMFSIFWSGPPGADPVDRLFENDASGSFVDVAPTAQTDLKSMSFSATAADLDRDGLTDIVVSCFKQWNKVFYNDPSGVFSLMAPASNPNYSYSMSDLAPAAPSPSEDFPSLPDADLSVLPFLGLWSMPTQVADFNADGWLDVVSVCWSNQLADADPTSALGAYFSPKERSHLYLNRGDQDGDGLGDGEFREVGEEVEFEHIGGAMGLVVGDYNGDGLPDIYIGGGGPKLSAHIEEDYIYINEPTAWPVDFQRDPDQPLTRAFFEVGALSGTYANGNMSHGLIARARSGRLDIPIGNGGPAAFDAGQPNFYFENQGNDDLRAYNLVEVSLAETTSAPGANGARVELIRDNLGGPGQVLVQERIAGTAFASHNAGPLVFGLGSGGLLFSSVRWPSGVHQGRLHWLLDPSPSQIAFTEPTTSLSLDAVYPAGGGMTLQAKLFEHGSAPTTGHLFFLKLTPVAPGQHTLDLLAPVALGVTLTPGVELSLAATSLSPLTGLYALAFVDASTLKITNAAALWHEPALEDSGPSPASYLPPPLLGDTDAPQDRVSSARTGWPIHPVRRRLELRVDRAEISPARAPLDWRPLVPGHHALECGDRLSLDGDGWLEVVIEGALTGHLDLADDAPILTLGQRSSCCDTRSSPHTGSLLRLHGLTSLKLDGRPVSRLGVVR